MADFNSTSETFLTWFKSQPGAQFHSSLTITDLRSRHAGRGIVANEDIPADTELFRIPRSSVICVDTSEVCKKIPSVFTTVTQTTNNGAGGDPDEMDVDIEFPDPWLDLIVVMVYEYLRGEKSRWKPYFDVLPTEFNALMFWKGEELEELVGSGIVGRIGREDADKMFREKLVPIVEKHEDVFYDTTAQESSSSSSERTKKLSADELVELAHRMGSTIMSYAFDLEKDTPEDEDDEEADEDGWVVDKSGVVTMGMVPMADMLNADAEFNAHLNHGEEYLTMTSLRLIPKGEEVLNYYGPLANSELLRRYGYTSTKHSRYDVVEISWESIASIINREYNGREKKDFDEDDEEFEDSFVLERETGDPDDTGLNTSTAEFKSVPEELLSQIARSIGPALGVDVENGNPSKSERRMLKAASLEMVRRVIEERIKAYKTTIEEDEDILTKETTTGRLKMAVEVRLGEKKLLVEARSRMRYLIQSAQEAIEGEGRVAKRTRF